MLKKTIWSVAIMAVIGLAIFATPVYKLVVIKAAEYQWQKFMEESIVETKNNLDTFSYFTIDPKNVMANLRVNTFVSSLKPAFGKERAWETLYCAYTLPHWDYYKVSQRDYEQPLLKMRFAMMNAAKSYFADTTNLKNFYQKHSPEIVDTYNKANAARKAELINVLTATEKVFGNVINNIPMDSLDYNEDYLNDYALRRLKEGGQPLVKCYRDIAIDLKNKIEKQNLTKL